MKVICDIDGCITDFNGPFVKLANHLLNMQISETFSPNTWYYMTQELGVSKQDDEKLWRSVAMSDFWEKVPLDPTVTDRVMAKIGLMTRLHDVYFVTSRVGKNAKVQTERWMKAHGVPMPTVIIASAKGMICKAIGADWAMDDNISNVLDMYNYSPSTHIYLKSATWNIADQDGLPNDIKVVSSIKEAMDLEGL